MHLRRVLALMAMVLVVTAVVVAVAPPKREQVVSRPGTAPAPARDALPRSVALRFPPARRAPTVRLVAGDHAVVEVTTSVSGVAGLMGLSGTAEPGTPATFDVLAQAPGRYAATFAPQFGRPERIGTIDVAP